MVLGIGASATLAAWNDSVWTSAEFGIATWNMQASVVGGAGNWQEYNASPGGGLTFVVNPLTLSPGNSVNAVFGLRETENNLASQVIIKQPQTPPGDTLAPDLKVQVRDLGTATSGPTSCNGTTGTVIIASTQLTTVGDSSPVAVAAGGYRWLCFTIQLDSGSTPPYPSGPTPVTWEFQATSV